MQKSSLLFLFAPLAAAGSLEASTLLASDPALDDFFGYSVSLSGTIGFVGVYGDDIASTNQGSAYVFRGLDSSGPSVTEDAKVTAADRTTDDFLGYSVSVSGTIGLAGAYADNVSTVVDQGSAYVFRNLDTVTGTATTQSAKLTASDGAASNFFGSAVSVSGTIGVVGAYGNASTAGATNSGAAYVYRNLDTVTGTVAQNVKLEASGSRANDFFGAAVSVSGTTGMVGAYGFDVFIGPANGPSQGAAFVYRGLDTATGKRTENTRLTASDGAVDDFFGFSVSLSGNIGLAGAYGDDIGTNGNQGSAYVFRGLDSTGSKVNENAKLVASDGAASDFFGASVAISGSTGLVGAHGDASGRGSAYLFLGLDTATGTISQNLKITAQSATLNGFFGRSVSLDGDLFLIGEPGASVATIKNGPAGKANSGSVSSMTTLDVGGASRTISGINFETWDDWIIGKTTDSNTVTLSSGHTATVTGAGKAVYIGKDAGSDSNTLVLTGTLTAPNIYVGAASNSNNVLQIGSNGTGGALSTTSTITNNGVVVFNRSNAVTQGTHFGTAGISGSGSLEKRGAGVLTLNAANTYTGPTTITAGTLTLASTGSIADSSSISVGSGTTFNVSAVTGGWTLGASQTLKGTGGVTGAASISGKHAPGNDAIGKQSFSSHLTYSTGSVFTWELAPDVAGDTIGTRGTNYDAVNVGGTLGGSGAIFKVVLGSGGFGDDFWKTSRTWTNIFTNTAETTSLTLASIFSGGIELWQGGTNVTTAPSAYRFTISGSDLNWAPVPEPTSAIGGLLLIAGLLRRRR